MQEITEQKQLRIWTFFTQWISQIMMGLSYTKSPCISSLDMLLCTLNIAVAKISEFLVCIVTVTVLLEINRQKKTFYHYKEF